MFVNFSLRSIAVGNSTGNLELTNYIAGISTSQVCTKAINDHINSIEINLVNDGRIGRFYKYVNKKLNGFNGIAPLKDCNGKLVSSDVIDDARLLTKVHTTIPSVFFTPELVLKFIKQLKRKGSAGPDHLPAEFYKETGCTISFPLTLIF